MSFGGGRNTRTLPTLLCLWALTACNPSAPKSGAAVDGALASDTTTAGANAGAATSGAAQGPTARRHVKMVEATQESDALSAIRTGRLQAKADRRVLVVYVGATWCEPCRRFKNELSSGRLDERLGKVTLLTFDADKDGERLAAAGYTFKFVPFVALPSATGAPSDTQQASGKGGEAWRELLEKLDVWQSGIEAQ